MGWWKKLKVWQKAGIIAGGLHFVIYTPLLIMTSQIHIGEAGLGLLLIFIEWPWMALLDIFFGDALKVLPFDLKEYSLLVYGTFVYGLLGIILGLFGEAIKNFWNSHS